MTRFNHRADGLARLFSGRRCGLAVVSAGCIVAVTTTPTAAAVAAACALAFALGLAALGRIGAGQGVDKRLWHHGVCHDGVFRHRVGAAGLAVGARATAALASTLSARFTSAFTACLAPALAAVLARCALFAARSLQGVDTGAVFTGRALRASRPPGTTARRT